MRYFADALYVQIWGDWSSAFGMSITISKDAAGLLGLVVALSAMVGLAILAGEKDRK